MALRTLLQAFLALSLAAIVAGTVEHASSEQQRAGGRLYYLVQGFNGRIASVSPSGGSPTTVLAGLRNAPDGIAVDKQAGYIYFSNMTPGSIMRASLNGTGLQPLVQGKFRVGKQLVLVVEDGRKRLYWADREGMKVMRCDVDGKHVETVVDTSRDACTGAQCKHAVGVAVDTKNGWVYWTQKGAGGTGSIHRAPTRVAAGENLAARTGLQTILRGLPEPIDMRWVDGYGLYWTDRGHRAGGNSVNRMRFSAEAIAGKAQFPARASTLVTGLSEAIGIAVDTASGKMWFTDLGGHVYQSNLDGSAKRTIASGQGIVVGIDYVP